MQENNNTTPVVKKKGSKLLLVLVILLSIACAVMGSFLYLNKDKLASKNCDSVSVSGESVKENDTKCPEISYELNTNDYGLSARGAGINVSVDSSRTKATISYNGMTISKTFGLNWVVADDTATYQMIDTKSFDKKIVQVLVDGSGQSANSIAIIYLMEDGTVEYTPILKDINTNWGQTDKTLIFNSYGKLDVKDVMTLIPADASKGNTGGYHTVLAKHPNGEVTDLTDAFKATGNF